MVHRLPEVILLRVLPVRRAFIKARIQDASTICVECHRVV